MGRKEPIMDPYAEVAYGGMDVHYKFSRVTFRDRKLRVVRRERLEHKDRQELLRILSRWPRDVPIALEASFGWGWISDVMLQCGLSPRLSNCYKVEQMRKARGWAKNNRMDGDLTSLLPAEPDEWWRVWLAPPEVRDRREWVRYRMDLVQSQTRLKNQIHAVLHRHGIVQEFSDLFGTGGRKFLADLCCDGGGVLDGGALGALRGLLGLLQQVRARLAGIDRKLRKDLKTDGLVSTLKTIPGFGLILSHVLVAEIGDMTRFGSTKNLASYSLLAPRAHDSGEEDAEETPLGRHIGQRGNRTLKWAFLEAAHGAVRKGGTWRKVFDGYTGGGKKNRNRGYIKVARALAGVVRRVWLTGEPYQEQALSRPGSQKRRHRGRRGRGGTRSGTGWPYHPMVDVESPLSSGPKPTGSR